LSVANYLAVQRLGRRRRTLLDGGEGRTRRGRRARIGLRCHGVSSRGRRCAGLHGAGGAEVRNGFVDVHIMFSNDAVASQLLVYEEGGFLSKSHEVTGRSGIAVYRLPFWHYTTPLIARRGREHEARRWLLLGSFDFDPPPKRLRYR